MCLHKRLIGQLVQILLGDGFDTRLATQLFIVFQLNIVVFGIKDDKLIVSININDGNEVWNKCILGLLNKRFTVRCSPRALRFINQVDEFLMPHIAVLLGQWYGQSQSTDWLLQLVVHYFRTDLFPYQIETVRSEHTEAVKIVQCAAVGYVGIQCFQQKLFAGIELDIEFFDNALQDILLVTKVLYMLIGNIDTHNIEQIQQIGISQFLCTTGEDTLMQALEEIEIVIHTLHGQQFRVIRSVVA